MSTQPNNPEKDNNSVIILDNDAQQQRDFFDQPGSGGAGQSRRLFAYDGQFWEDPGPQYSIEEVMAFLADTYPELRHGTWSSRTLPDGTEEITFVKVTGEKGSGFTTMITDRLLSGTTPVDIQGVETLHRLIEVEEAGQLTADFLLVNAAQIEAALEQTDKLAQYSQRMVTRCLALKPAPMPRIPLGF
jgi:PRTRC genetic system protein C